MEAPITGHCSKPGECFFEYSLSELFMDALLFEIEIEKL
jgi:hypothetical protein